MQCWRIHIQVKDYWEDYKNKKNDTTKDFSSDGMLKCRQRHIENDSLCD